MLSFAELGLGPNLLKALEESGYDSPTPIQEQTIPAILSSKVDVTALAQTGTGKTAAFALPIMEQIDLTRNNLQALILCPTRELCIQIANSLEKYSQYVGKLNSVGVYGGANIMPQVKQLRAGCQIVVGTPGRTLDLIKRGDLDISEIQWLVLDEADEMLNMGFKEDLDAILENSPSDKQTMLFSATMSPEIQNIAKRYMNNPVRIEVGKRNNAAENVEHHYYAVQARDRYNCLKRLADFYPDIYGIVFCRTRQETKEIADKLIADGYNADALHGDLNQQQRENVMNKFRIKNLQILVATDVAARGLDITGLSHVINYNLPDESEIYIHRCGRTGRAGKSGISISIIHSREFNRIRTLEKVSGRKFEQKDVPTGQQICEQQLYSLVDKIVNSQVNEDQIAPYVEYIDEKLGAIDKTDLIHRFISLEFNTFLKFYEGAEDLNLNSRSRNDRDDRGDRGDSRGGREERGGRDRERGSRRDSRSNENFTRMHINWGSEEGLNPGKLIKILNQNKNLRNAEIGDISIMRKFSFFDIESSYADDAVADISESEYEGKLVLLDKAKPEDSANDTGRRSSGGSYGNRRSSGSSSGGRFSDRGRSDSRDRGGDRDSRGGGDRDSRSGGGRSRDSYSSYGDRDSRSAGTRDGGRDSKKKGYPRGGRR